MKQLWSVFFPGGFWRISQKFELYVRNFSRSTHMFICWRAGKLETRMKAQASFPGKEFEEQEGQ